MLSVDGIVGEVLFYSLRVVLGSAYTPEVHHVWIKIFCRMLRTIIPSAVYLELHNDAHNKHKHNNPPSAAIDDREQQQHPKKSTRDTSCSWEFSSVNNSSVSTSNDLAAVGSDIVAVAAVVQHHVGCHSSRIEEENDDDALLLERLEQDSYVSTKTYFVELDSDDVMLRAAEEVVMSTSICPHHKNKQFYQSTFA